MWHMRMHNECLAVCQVLDKVANSSANHGILPLLSDHSTVRSLIKKWCS